ncbi:hypothetical protein ACWDYH_35570 [Nocardia goodfellowii]
MTAILHRYGVAEADIHGPGVWEHDVDGTDLNASCAGKLDAESDAWNQRLREAADRPQRRQLREALRELQSEIPQNDEGLQTWLAERTAHANMTGPQVDHLAVFHGSPAVRCRSRSDFDASSECLEWVDPRAVLATLDPVWGVFDRSEPARCSLLEFCKSLRAARTSTELESWIDRVVIGRAGNPVQLIRVEGPAGPVYEIRTDGTHRAHLARVFGLPLMALTKTSHLPRTLVLADHPDSPVVEGVSSSGFGRFGSLWEGLRAHGVLDIAEDTPAAWSAEWTPARIVAEWMLFAPDQAVAVNRAYDRVYPGALQEAMNLHEAILFDETAWTDHFVADRAAAEPEWARTHPAAPSGRVSLSPIGRRRTLSSIFRRSLHKRKR